MVIIECKKCRAAKADTDFGLWRGRLNKWCKECRDRNNQWYSSDKYGRKTKAKLYYQQAKNKIADYRSDLRLDRKYSLTRKGWNDMLTEQKGLCGICGKGMKNPCVDHDHITGRVRGLLHRGCNLRLQAVEDADFLSKAKTYLNSTMKG